MNRSSLKVTLPVNMGREPSPTPEARHRLQVPGSLRSGESKYMWGEEEVELIQTCALLSSSLGLYKSLSTSDIIFNDGEKYLRPWVSEQNMESLDERIEEIFPGKFEPISRSCSTWVAVGDMVSSSQLPSPQARHGPNNSPAITAVDFIRSINKKVRQSYIRKRLLMSYRVLRRNPQCYQAPSGDVQKGNSGIQVILPTSSRPSQEIFEMLQKEVSLPNVIINNPTVKPTLSARDIERDKGRPLTRFERNMIIFNWLQSLEESAETE